MSKKQTIGIVCAVLIVCAMLAAAAYYAPKPYSGIALGGLVLVVGVCGMMSKTS